MTKPQISALPPATIREIAGSENYIPLDKLEHTLTVIVPMSAIQGQDHVSVNWIMPDGQQASRGTPLKEEDMDKDVELAFTPAELFFISGSEATLSYEVVRYVEDGSTEEKLYSPRSLYVFEGLLPRPYTLEFADAQLTFEVARAGFTVVVPNYKEKKLGDRVQVFVIGAEAGLCHRVEITVTADNLHQTLPAPITPLKSGYAGGGHLRVFYTVDSPPEHPVNQPITLLRSSHVYHVTSLVSLGQPTSRQPYQGGGCAPFYIGTADIDGYYPFEVPLPSPLNENTNLITVVEIETMENLTDHIQMMVIEQPIDHTSNSQTVYLNRNTILGKIANITALVPTSEGTYFSTTAHCIAAN
ncbi:hypothetical protein ACJ70E_23765 [Pseudomonas plecoglossicida]|uniref:hypothetical protein n=1 Tax=Pseudomonas plecoglossicida TaxID=70775 RepID=UPI0039774475